MGVAKSCELLKCLVDTNHIFKAAEATVVKFYVHVGSAYG